MLFILGERPNGLAALLLFRFNLVIEMLFILGRQRARTATPASRVSIS